MRWGRTSAIGMSVGLCIAWGCADEAPSSLPPPGSRPGSPVAAEGDEGDLPEHCRLAGEPAETEGPSLPRFDVGTPGGEYSFPLDCEQAAAQGTNLGCEFFAVDLPNDPRGTDRSPPASQQQFAVVVANPSGLDPATVEVFVPHEAAAFTTVTVEPGAAETIELPALSIETAFSTDNGHAYRIESDLPITAYQFNPLDNTVEVHSNDATLLIPTHALGTDYTAITGQAILLATGPDDPEPVNAGAYVAVVATADDTTVSIDAAAPLVAPPPPAVTIDRGRVLTIISSYEPAPGDLTGTVVHADKPVAVFSGNVATIIPRDTGACCADHLEHQLSPYEAWGNGYAVAPPADPDGEGEDPAEYRVVAAFDDTEFVYCPEPPPGAPARLQAGQSARFNTSRAFTIRSDDPTKSFAVAQFLRSFGANDGNTLGDPGLLILPAAAQFERRYVFVIPAGYVRNRITLVRRGTGRVQLDGEAVPEDAWRPLGVLEGAAYGFAHLEVFEGPHAIESEIPVGLSVFGYDEAVSYAFPGGAGLRVISVPPVAG